MSAAVAANADCHSFSWLTLAELRAFDYDAPMEDRRVSVMTSSGIRIGADTAPPGGGEMTTYRRFLEPPFFDWLDRIEAAGGEVVAFWFDN